MRRVNTYQRKHPPGIMTLFYRTAPFIWDAGTIIPAEEYYNPILQRPTYSLLNGNIVLDFHRKIYKTHIYIENKILYIPELHTSAYFYSFFTNNQVLNISLINLADNVQIDISILGYLQFTFSVSSFIE